MTRSAFLARTLLRARPFGCQSSLLPASSASEQWQKAEKDDAGPDSVHVNGRTDRRSINRSSSFHRHRRHSASDHSNKLIPRPRTLLRGSATQYFADRKAGVLQTKISEASTSDRHKFFHTESIHPRCSIPRIQVGSGHELFCQLRTCTKSHRASLHLASDNEEKVDPFSLVADELSSIANRLRAMVSTEVPKLASAAEYFFKIGVEGKRFRPMILLLMASSMTIVLPDIGISESTLREQQLRQQRIAEITEMIHVASLLHDDVLDSAETRRGIGSLNFVMGNKLAVLAGDFLLSRASVSLASLKNTEVVELLSKVLEHLVTGEIMQLTSNKEKSCSMDYYLEKTFYKTASLMANSCKSIALLAGQSSGVATLAYDYGRHLGMAFQLVDDMLDFTGTTASLGKGALSDIRQGIVTAPLLFALEQEPHILDLISRKFKNAGDVELAVELLKKTDGIEKTRQLAAKHASQAAEAIHSLPPVQSERARKCRQALVDVTEQVLTRTK